jgi:FkbM family methyltransferase
MPGGVNARWKALRSVLLREPQMSTVTIREAVRDAVSWYGLSRWRIARTVTIAPLETGLVWLDLGRYGIAWPEYAPLDRLYTALVEVTAASNPHFYFREPTVVRASDHVVDVGSCEGAFALEAIVRYGAARAWCFEPAPAMARALRTTAVRNSLSERIVVVEAAASSSTGVAELHEDHENPLVARTAHAATGGERRPSIRVEQLSLDDWVRRESIDHVDFIKIDAEGDDLRVLEGARELLARWKPRIAVTTYHEPTHCNEMIEYLTELRLGYRFRASGVVSFGSTARPVMLHAIAEGTTKRAR